MLVVKAVLGTSQGCSPRCDELFADIVVEPRLDSLFDDGSARCEHGAGVKGGQKSFDGNGRCDLTPQETLQGVFIAAVWGFAYPKKNPVRACPCLSAIHLPQYETFHRCVSYSISYPPLIIVERKGWWRSEYAIGGSSRG